MDRQRRRGRGPVQAVALGLEAGRYDGHCAVRERGGTVMAETRDLAQVLADAREEAQVLRRAGNIGQAEYVDALVSKVRDAAEDFMTWLSEPDAMLKSGLSERTLRRRFRDMIDCGTA